MAIDQPLSVTVVAGYLGSGKTTFINQRLSSANGLRYGVLVNDFGQLNIDESLIQESGGNTISLTNGCVCCSIAHDVAAAVAELSERSDELDWVLFEASGVADPSRVVTQVQSWPGYELDSLLTLVDASRIQMLIRDKFVGDHISLQLGGPGVRKLTKQDLVSTKKLSEIEIWLQQKFPTDEKQPYEDFYSQTISAVDPVTDTQLKSWLQAVPETVVRIKGFLNLDGEQVLLQWVSGRFELTKPNTRSNHYGLVAIGVAPFQLPMISR